MSMQFYDWSSLDRAELTKIVSLARKDIVGKPLKGPQFTKIIRSHIRASGIPVNIKSVYEKHTPLNSVWIGGLYESYRDRKNRKAITIILHYTSKKDLMNFTYLKFRKVCKNIADTILHEIMHARQYRRRNYLDIPGYQSTAASSKQRVEQEYLGHNDEIDAYAFNIACELTDRFKGNRKKTIEYISKDLSDQRLSESLFRMYLKAFDFNHDHKVIKKLKKKIVHYLPYVELGKPYKTSDWLKW